MFASFLDPSPATGSFFSVVIGLPSPASRTLLFNDSHSDDADHSIHTGGSLTLNSSDPFDFPLIDPGLFNDPLDTRMMVQAIKTSEKLVATSPFKGFINGPFGAFAKAKTDAQIVAYLKNSTSTFYHPCGTAKMGTANDPMAVVNSKLQLKGAQGVRIVDASVFVRLAFKSNPVSAY